MPNTQISLVGVPFDAKSSFLTGPVGGPSAIRKELFSGASNLYSEIGVNLDNVDGFKELIDLRIDNSDDGYLEIEKDTKTLKSINLDDFSIEDLKEYIEQLKKEIERVKNELEKKLKSQIEAEKYFK